MLKPEDIGILTACAALSNNINYVCASVWDDNKVLVEACQQRTNWTRLLGHRAGVIREETTLTSDNSALTDTHYVDMIISLV